MNEKRWNRSTLRGRRLYVAANRKRFAICVLNWLEMPDSPIPRAARQSYVGRLLHEMRFPTLPLIELSYSDRVDLLEKLPLIYSYNDLTPYEERPDAVAIDARLMVYGQRAPGMNLRALGSGFVLALGLYLLVVGLLYADQIASFFR